MVDLRTTLTHSLVLILTTALTTVGMRSASSAPSQRVALVIGNSDYGSDRLKNPLNDARAVAQRLKQLGFVVDAYEDLDQRQMIEYSFDFFHHKAANSALRIVYFAGHGAEYEGHNYLIPVDADITQPEEFPQTSFMLDELRRNLDKLKRGVSILILDMCRVKACPSKRCRGVMSTLGFNTEPKSSGTLIAYSTSLGELASDGVHGEHSVYTEALLRLLAIPALPVEKLFRRLTEEVYNQSQYKQRPEFVDGLMGDDVCLNGGPLGECTMKQ